MITFSLLTLSYLMFSHWIADFAFQTRYMAENKSKRFDVLAAHCFVYSLVMSLGFYFTNGFATEFTFTRLIVFYGYTIVLHTIVDFITSRINAVFYKQNNIHAFFCNIGLDQYIHFVLLLFTLGMLNTFI